MEAYMNDLNIQIKTVENQTEWRRIIDDELTTIGTYILVHVASLNLLGLRLCHCCCSLDTQQNRQCMYVAVGRVF